MRKPPLLTILLLAACTFAINAQHSLDLKSMVLDGIELSELDIETTTEIFGRPSSIKKQPDFLADILGPELFYHDLGINFRFSPENGDRQGKLSVATFYLVKAWDEDASMFYYPVEFEMSPDLNAELKISDIVELFREYNPEVLTAKERKEEVEKAGLGVTTKFTEDVVRFTNEPYSLNFLCEEVTDFLERFTIIFEIIE